MKYIWSPLDPYAVPNRGDASRTSSNESLNPPSPSTTDSRHTVGGCDSLSLGSDASAPLSPAAVCAGGPPGRALDTRRCGEHSPPTSAGWGRQQAEVAVDPSAQQAALALAGLALPRRVAPAAQVSASAPAVPMTSCSQFHTQHHQPQQQLPHFAVPPMAMVGGPWILPQQVMLQQMAALHHHHQQQQQLQHLQRPAPYVIPPHLQHKIALEREQQQQQLMYPQQQRGAPAPHHAHHHTQPVPHQQQPATTTTGVATKCVPPHVKVSILPSTPRNSSTPKKAKKRARASSHNSTTNAANNSHNPSHGSDDAEHHRRRDSTLTTTTTTAGEPEPERDVQLEREATAPSKRRPAAKIGRPRRNRSGQPAEEDEVPKKYCCRYCPKTFQYSSNRSRHESIHTGRRPYKCTHCGMGFANSSNRRKHEQAHLNRSSRLFSTEAVIHEQQRRLHQDYQHQQATYSDDDDDDNENDTDSAPFFQQHQQRHSSVVVVHA